MSLLRRCKDFLQGKAPFKARRHPEWRAVRLNHLKLNPLCAVCGGSRKIEVHHIVAFHVNPSRELDPDNLITLCEAKRYGVTCHLLVGHRGDYRISDPFVRERIRVVREILNTEDICDG